LYGFARGDEAVRFVSRVRTYYDVLVKADQRQQRLQTRPNMLDVRAPAI
jgi:membrane-bound lytic murein transglycosylase MltF